MDNLMHRLVWRYVIKRLDGYLLTSPIAVVIGMGTAIVLQSGEDNSVGM